MAKLGAALGLVHLVVAVADPMKNYIGSRGGYNCGVDAQRLAGMFLVALKLSTSNPRKWYISLYC